MFETDALRLFDVAARMGSFTAAAERLNYTQSAVSRRIASLEREANGPLFERLARGVRLTPAGILLHRHAREVLDRLDRAAAELAAVRDGSGGPLRIGAFATANVVLLPEALRAFRRDSPAVEVTLAEGMSAGLMERLGEGALDLAVVSDYPSGLARAGEARLIPLCVDELLVALPGDHRLARREVIELGELRDENWIEGVAPGHATMLAEACARAGFTPRVGIRIGEWIAKFGYVAAGLGVSLVPSMAARAVRAGLVLRPLGEHAPRRRVYVALPGAAPLPSAEALLRLLLRGAAEWRPAGLEGSDGFPDARE